MQLFTGHIGTPIGRLGIGVDGDGSLRRIAFLDDYAPPAHDQAPATGVRDPGAGAHEPGPPAHDRAPDSGVAELEIGDAACTEAANRALAVVGDRLGRYFAGELDALDGLDVAPPGSRLQRAVWAAVRQVPAGQVVSYGELARRLGYAGHGMARSVGTANATNPVALVVPCHRVIGKDGSLRGYAWGLARKRWLLDHERARIGAAAMPALAA